MKKLLIIAIVAAIAVPVMAVQIIGPSTSPSGTIPVMMTIDRYAEILLPDQIVLVSTDPTSLAADWDNSGSLAIVNFKTNFNCELVVSATTEPAYLGIGAWDITLTGISLPAGSAIGADMGDYTTYEMGTPVSPTTWYSFSILLELLGVDLTNAAYSPTAVQVGHVDITVVSQ